LYKYINDKELNIEFEYFSTLISCNLNGCAYHPGLDLIGVYNKIFDNPRDPNKNFTFGAGAQFIVSKDRILMRQKEFYEKILKIVDYDAKPIEGYCIERLHRLIFHSMIEIQN